MLGEKGQAEHYPGIAAPNQPLAVTIGLANHERAARTYQIEVWSVDGGNPDEQSLLVQADQITLKPGEQHEQPVTWQMPAPGTYRVEFRLFVDSAPAGQNRVAEPYRRLDLWVDVAA